MSAVELAVRKVKKLYARQARELLDWLSHAAGKRKFSETTVPNNSSQNCRTPFYAKTQGVAKLGSLHHGLAAAANAR